MPNPAGTPKGKRGSRLPLVTSLTETFGFSPGLASILAAGIMALCVLALVWVFKSAPPRHLSMATGPEGSAFQKWALSYQKELAARGVKLDIVTTAGSRDNLQRLQSPDGGADVGFVTGGLKKGDDVTGVVSLGSVGYQPLWIFYRGEADYTRLSQLAGKRIGIGSPGSATRELALTLLEANGITGAPTVFNDLDSESATDALLHDKLDVVFSMGDSVSRETLRRLTHSKDVKIFSFDQSDAYIRRYTYLNKIVLPEGSLDLGQNMPDRDVILLGPTVEFVAREDLHSALSDLLVEVAQKVHSRASILQKRGEFPAPLEHEIPLSDDAVRFYKSGKGVVYRVVNSFWVASLLNRLLVAVVPLILVLIPALKMMPVMFRMRVQLRLYRCYRPLLKLEQETFRPLTAERIAELLAELDRIEDEVTHLKVPASFAANYYWLQNHLSSVRARLKAMSPAS
jgi:TRAP-type uncharacterized transport system substrate-binding protein